MACHDGSNPHLVNLNGYENLKKVTERDTGTGIFTLVRVSHIHLFGLTFVFFIMGSIFSHAYLRPIWLKCAIVALPFISLVLDVGSWYFTKLIFCWVVAAGAGMGPRVRLWVVSVSALVLPYAVPCPGWGEPPSSADHDAQSARNGATAAQSCSCVIVS
jgi:hypothetical protein